MQAIKVWGHVGPDGILKLEVPVKAVDQDVEAVVVIQTSAEDASLPVDANGYPFRFFETLDRIEADDLVERRAQGQLETRGPLE